MGALGAGMAIGGATWLMQAQGKTQNTLAGAMTGAGIGTMIAPGIGTAIGAGIGAVGGFVKGLIGGPTAAEKEGRAAAASFRDGMLKELNPSQMAEVQEAIQGAWKGNEAGAATMIAVRDAYIATGRSAEDAEEIVKRLWEAEKGGAEEVAKVMEVINGIREEAMEQEKKLIEGLAKSVTAINAIADSMKNLAKDTENGSYQFQTLGSYALPIFSALVKETGSVRGALAELEPTLSVIAERQKTVGDVADQSILQLLRIREVTEANKENFDSLDQLTQLLVGLGDAGMLTAQNFNLLSTDIGAHFQVLSDKGLTANEIMTSMQPTLQALWEAQQKFGRSTNETTNALIDQAVQQGIVGEGMKDVNEKILDVLLAIGDALGAQIPEALKKAADATQEAADQQQEALDPVLQTQEDLIRNCWNYNRAWDQTSDGVFYHLQVIENGMGDVYDAQGNLIQQVDGSNEIWQNWARNAEDAARQVAESMASAESAVEDFGEAAVDSSGEAYDAINEVTYGASPGGIKDIISHLEAATEAMGIFKSATVNDMGAAADVVSGATQPGFVTPDFQTATGRDEGEEETLPPELVNINFYITAMDGQSVERVVEEKIVPAITVAVRRDRQGIRSNLGRLLADQVEEKIGADTRHGA
jgi:hypothetical protein